MAKNKLLLLPVLIGVSCLTHLKAEEPHKFYRLEFTAKEVDSGKVVNSRSYVMLISNEHNSRGSIRTGSVVSYRPVASVPNYQTAQVGINIDCRFIEESDGDIALEVTAEMSSLAPVSAAGEEPPAIRQNKWSSGVLVPLSKPTVVFASDDPSSKRNLQIEITAVPLKRKLQ